MHVPEGWKDKTIGDLVKFSGGSQPPRSTFEFELKDEYVRLIQIRDYKTDKFATYVPIKLAKKFCTKEDIMIGRYGPPIFQILQGIEGAYNVALIKAIPSKYVERDYLFYFLKQETLFRFIDCLSQRSSGQTGIEMDALNAYPFPLPPISEQQKIAQILSTWDQAIEKQEALIAAKQKRKKALMQKLLTGKKRFAGFEGMWKEVELGKLFKEVKDKVGSEQVIPHSITAGTGFVSHEEKWGKDISGSQYENYTLLRKGQFSYNKGNSKKYACGCMYLLKHSDEIAVPNVFISFERRNEAVCNEFYEQYFMADYCARELRKYITSGARSDGLLNLNKADFFSIKVPLPDFKEQQKIAQILSAADTEIETHQKQLSALKEQKKGLMQQLLTGKKRVKDMAHD